MDGAGTVGSIVTRSKKTVATSVHKLRQREKGSSSPCELCVVIRAKVAQFLFDLTSNLPHCDGSERAPPLKENLRRILRKITANQIHTKDDVRQGRNLCRRATVSDNIVGVPYGSGIVELNVPVFLDDVWKNSLSAMAVNDLLLSLCWRRTRQLTPSPWRSSTGDLTT